MTHSGSMTYSASSTNTSLPPSYRTSMSPKLTPHQPLTNLRAQRNSSPSIVGGLRSKGIKLPIDKGPPCKEATTVAARSPRGEKRLSSTLLLFDEPLLPASESRLAAKCGKRHRKTRGRRRVLLACCGRSPGVPLSTEAFGCRIQHANHDPSAFNTETNTTRFREIAEQVFLGGRRLVVLSRLHDGRKAIEQAVQRSREQGHRSREDGRGRV